MDDMQSKLGEILGNPEMMQKIMAFAQNFNQNEAASKQENLQEASSPFPQFDPAMLQKFSAVMGQSGIDNNQQTLLRALNPYLSGRKVEKLERAMRAAKMAQAATSLLGSAGLLSLTGR